MWTDEQKEAINKEGQNIIVSAGAGSGKTAVLSERVIRKLNDGVNVNEILMLTFTAKAAKEMKDRIRKKIIKAGLNEQINLLNVSYISTFDSYASKLVKKYSYLVDIDKNFNIELGNILEIAKIKILDEIFEEYYELDDGVFDKFIKDFCLKSDDAIKKQIINVSNSLDLKYDKEDYLKDYVDNYFSDSYLNNLVNDYEVLIKNKIKDILNLIDPLLSLYDLNDIYTRLENCLHEDYNYIYNNLNISKRDIKLKDDKDVKQSVNTLIDEINNLLIYSNKSSMINEINYSKDYVILIINIINKLDNKLNEYKKENNIYSFTDIAKKAIDIVKYNSDIANEIKNSFNEIMIDEYQDTSDLQEIFISYISKDNLYMVGDIKQSIYGFRNANPMIFKNKYDSYKNNMGGYKIDLSKNFRSNSESVFAINKMFSSTMTDSVGGASYEQEHQMIFGNINYKENENFNIDLFNYEVDDLYTKEEQEIFMIAKDIKEKVGSYQIMDKENNEYRPLQYSDISILISKSNYFDLYKKIFEYLKIPIVIHTEKNITENINIKLIKNILEYIVDYKKGKTGKKFNYNLLSIGRSYLFSYEDEYLFDLIKNKISDDKLNEIVKSIDMDLTISEIINDIYDKFDIYNKLVLIGDVKENLMVLDYILDLASLYENMGKNIEDFIEYINDLIKYNLSIKLKVLEDNVDGVNVMTIHKSKGLEFNLCYFPEVYDRFYIPELKDKVLFGDSIIIPYINGYYKNTIVKKLYENKYKNDIISEKVRLFYVALTRARDKIIILNSVNEDYSKVTFNSFKDIVDSVSSIFYKNIIDKEIYVDKNYLLNSKKYSIDYTSTTVEVNELEANLEMIDKSKFSKEESYGNRKNKDLGTKLHYILEMIDFNNPNLDKYNIEEVYKNKINVFLNSKLFKDKIINIYKEYEFIEVLDNKKRSGIIDLLLEYEDKFRIVDYKLKHIEDKGYIEQLNGYKSYLEKNTNKKIEIYLYSILDEKIIEI